MALTVLHHSSWAQSALGKPLELFSSLHSTERPFLFIGGIHGDEPEGVTLATEFLSWLQKNNNESLKPWILIPCLNVDGFAQKARTNGNGVDLNRNFPSPDWSADIKSQRYNPGPFAASEPEVHALIELIETENPLAIIHFHSWEPCVVYTGAPGKEFATILVGETGYVVSEDIGYPTPGSLGQFGWLAHQIPVICIEEQEKISQNLVWPRFQKGLIRLLSR